MTLREEKLIGGRPWLEVANVTRPTMTIYSPKGRNSGAAVIVFPGGGYRVLAIDLEGTEVCDWLTSIGVTCVLLKYRVPGSGPYWDRGNGMSTALNKMNDIIKARQHNRILRLSFPNNDGPDCELVVETAHRRGRKHVARFRVHDRNFVG